MCILLDCREAALAAYAQVRQGYSSQPIEQVRAVLGTQPLAPGTIPVKYVKIELQGVGRELAVSSPYYVEPEPEWTQVSNEFAKMYDYDDGTYADTNAMMLVGSVPRM